MRELPRLLPLNGPIPCSDVLQCADHKAVLIEMWELGFRNIRPWLQGTAASEGHIRCVLLPSVFTHTTYNTETGEKTSETLYWSLDSFWLMKLSSGRQRASHLHKDSDGGLVDITKEIPST